MQEEDFTVIHYYDQDIVDLYDKSWVRISESYKNPKGAGSNSDSVPFFNHPDSYKVNLFEACMSVYFLVYNTGKNPVSAVFDYFYSKQEENGAIRGEYDLTSGEPVFEQDNPEGVLPPLFALSEYNLYHKVGNKRRLKEILPTLERYYEWLETTFMQSNGLYSVPLSATMMVNSPRKDAYYPIDFNAQQAINALYMSSLGDVLNDKDISFKYKKKYFALKTKIGTSMWDSEDGFFYDLNKNEEMVKVKSLASYWTLLAEIPNEAKLDSLVDYLKDPKHFGTENPFPTLSVSDPSFSEEGNGFCGGVYPAFTYMVIKGLGKYKRYAFARECSLKHIFSILDTVLSEDPATKGCVFEAYRPDGYGPAVMKDESIPNRKNFYTYVGLATIALMIENVIGLYISLPKKTVDWIVPTLEKMGIENLYLKRNKITILSNKTTRGWEVRLESEKLYYFTLKIFGMIDKTLPIPSGKCSMLIDRL